MKLIIEDVSWASVGINITQTTGKTVTKTENSMTRETTTKYIYIEKDRNRKQ